MDVSYMMDKLKQNSNSKNSNSKNSNSKNSNSICVYMLQCGDGTLYTGWTNNFEKRLVAHRSGKGAKYTRSRGPLIPVYLELLPDKISATKREAAIKKLPRKKKLLLINSTLNVL